MSSKERAISGLSSFGKGYAIYSLITSLVFTVVMVAIGILLISYRSHLRMVTGVVTKKSVCSNTNYGKDSVTSCTTSVNYKVDNVEETDHVFIGTKFYALGTKIDVYYNPSDIKDSQIEVIPWYVGWLLILFGVLILGSSIAWVYFTQTSKTAAAVYGGAGAINTISNAFR